MKVKLRNPDREVEVAGGRKVHDVLGELGIDPDTVLVIRERELLTREDRVAEADLIEVRPVISGGSGNRMKCRRCKAPAVVEVRRHNAAFCRDCFLHHVREQVKRAIDAYDMFEPDDRVLVAVSGGKDSLALWDVLLELGYRTDGLYLSLGIGEYSERSGDARSRASRSDRSAHLIEVDLAGEYGFDVPTAGKRGSRRPVRSAGCRSATCSTGRRSSTATTSWRPATTSTTRRPRCSGTRCGGRPTTSPASSPCCRPRKASRAR